MQQELVAPEVVTEKALAATTPMRLIELALNRGVEVEKLTGLFDLQIRWEQNEARKAFVEAMNRFKADAPEITKNKHVDHNDFWHATLDNIVGTIAPSLSKVGITHRWKTGSENGKIRVTCVLTHSMGHSEETTLEAGPDASGSKNPIQAVASTVTYLERYTLMAATGLAAVGQDDDGRKADATGGLDPDAANDWGTAIKDSQTLQDMQDNFNKAVRAAQAANDDDAVRTFTKIRDTRKQQIQTRR